LVTVPNGNSALLIDLHSAGPRFEEGLMHHVGSKGILKNLVGLTDSLIDISFASTLYGLNVLQGRVHVGAFVCRIVRMQCGRFGFESLHGVEDSTQLFVVNFNPFQCLFDSIPVDRGNSDDPFSDIAHTVSSQDWLVSKPNAHETG
jgi:hypothetical protein